MSNILILNGSPRANGNTEMLVDAFIKGAEGAGHKAVKMNLEKMKIHPCIGCLKGGKDKKSPCVQKDDMDKVYEEFANADVVVFASPMYYWAITAQLKAVLDRLYAAVEANDHKTPYKECVLLMPAGDATEENFAPVVSYYGTLAGQLGWKDRGMVLAGGLFEVGDIKGSPFLKEAEELGASL